LPRPSHDHRAGTNIRLAAIPADRLASRGPMPPESVGHRARYRTADFGHLRDALHAFQRELPVHSHLSACALSVCGPVVDGVALCLAATMGADGWRLDEAELAEALGLRAGRFRLLNDFVAVGLALPAVPPEDRRTVHEGKPIKGRPIACLGPGTGLGQVFGVYAPARVGGASELVTCPSEGGESDFVALTAEQWALREFVSKSLSVSHVKVEHVVSGSAIERIWRFLIERRRERDGDGAGGKGQKRGRDDADEQSVECAIRAAKDPSAAILERSMPGDERADPTCVAALDLFIDALGAELGNLAMRFQAFGGVFIAGGVTSKIAARLMANERLRRAYLNKGASTELYEGCPLYVVTVPGDELGMNGCWEFALSDACGFL
jgi:glucokinase